MAKFYDKAMQSVEKSCLAKWRREILADISGDVLEIGCGTGVNLAYYPATVSRLTLTDMDAHMLKMLEEKAANGSQKKYTVRLCSADTLDFPDNSFDAVVSTLVLCSVQSVSVSLNQIKRVLKPKGKLYFIEHTINHDPRIMKWQKRLQPLWSTVAGNCHLTRDTRELLLQTGFTFESFETTAFHKAPKLFSPVIKGVAKNNKENI